MNRQYIGVDLHKGVLQACAVTASRNRVWEGRFPRTAEGIARFVARGVGPARAVAVEASRPTWAFVDTLTPTGATVCVVDPRKTRLKAGYAAETDRLDARRLADALSPRKRGEHLHPAPGDSCAARGVSLPPSAGAAADQARANDPVAVVAP